MATTSLCLVQPGDAPARFVAQQIADAFSSTGHEKFETPLHGIALDAVDRVVIAYEPGMKCDT